MPGHPPPIQALFTGVLRRLAMSSPLCSYVCIYVLRKLCWGPILGKDHYGCCRGDMKWTWTPNLRNRLLGRVGSVTVLLKKNIFKMFTQKRWEEFSFAAEVFDLGVISWIRCSCWEGKRSMWMGKAVWTEAPPSHLQKPESQWRACLGHPWGCCYPVGTCPNSFLRGE